MINYGVNPYIVDHDGESNFHHFDLSHLKIPEMSKSVHFSIYPDESYPAYLQDAWCYSNGTFEGNFDDEIIGEGSEGVVLRGEWINNEAAFKFVQIHKHKKPEFVDGGLEDLKKRLTEFNVLRDVEGTHLIKNYGHYRLV